MAAALEIRELNEELGRIEQLEKKKTDDLFKQSYSSSSSETESESSAPQSSQVRRLHESLDASNPTGLSDLTGDWADDHDLTYTHHDVVRQESPSFNCNISPIKGYSPPAELRPLNLMDSETERDSSASPVTSSPIKPARNIKKELPPLKMPRQPLSNDDILMRSTMMGSVHPSQSVHNLVDTSDDLEEHGVSSNEHFLKQ